MNKYPDTLKEVRSLFGRNLRRIRLDRNLFQKEVAQMVGVNTTYIHGMEKGLYCPSLRNLCVFANTLRVSTEDFFRVCSKIKHRDMTARINRRMKYEAQNKFLLRD